MYQLLLTYFCLSSAITANKIVLGTLPTALFVGIRMLIAGGILYIYNYTQSERMKWSYFKYDLFKIIGIALLTTTGPSLLKAYALKHLFSAKQSLIGSCDPFITAIYAYILFSQRLTLVQLTGILVGFSGIALTIWTHSAPEASLNAWLMFSYPELAMLIGISIGRYGWIRIRSLLQTGRYKPTELSSLFMVISGFLALGVSYLTESWSSLGTISMPAIGAFAYTIVVGNIIGYTLFAICFKRYNITFVSLAGFLIPVFVGIFGWVLLGEPISTTLLIAGVLIFLGLVIFNGKQLITLYTSKDNV